MWILLLFLSQAWAAPTPPASSNDNVRLGGIARVFFEQENRAFLAEINLAGPSDGRKPWDYTLGWYYSFTPNFKAGAFFREAYGQRHDDDWHSDNGVWKWKKTDNRREAIYIGDLTGKFQAGRHLIAELKTRLQYNSEAKDTTLLVRPGLNYFVMREGKLLGSVFAQLEMDFPLNYSTHSVSETWIYLGALIHKDMLDFGPFVTISQQTWTRPTDYEVRGGSDFAATTQTATLGGLLIVTL